METVRLGECAQIIRCQLARIREGEGGMACQEITLAEVNSLTSFVEPGKGEVVRVSLAPDTKQVKYLLARGDTILAFRGTMGTIGRVGLVLDAGSPAVTGQSLAIVRAHAVDSLWLFYFLNRPSVRDRLVGKATGGRLLALNVSALRDFHIPVPSLVEVEAIARLHADAVRLAGHIQTAQVALRDALANVEGFMRMTDELP